MVLGYDEPRPKEKDYREFLERFTSFIRKVDHPDVSLMIYGSYVRGEHNPGRSDIDAVIITGDDVVTDKDKILDLGKALHQALSINRILFQITLADIVSMRDGRFNSYAPDFQEYFTEEGKILVGPDYRNQFRFEMPQHPVQGPITFNLRKSRQGLLFFHHLQESGNYARLLEKFQKALDASSRGSKQILQMVDGNLRKNRFSALDTIADLFPDIPSAPLRRIKELYTNPKKLDELYKNPREVLRTWNESLTFLEQMIREYIYTAPRQEQ